MPRVPLLAEEQLYWARRFLSAYNQLCRGIGEAEHLEKEGLRFPASQGNTITGIDIVLDIAPDAGDADGDSDPEEKGAAAQGTE